MHHAVHDAADCPFCMTMQLGAAPAPVTQGPELARARRTAPVPEQIRIAAPILPAIPLARAPPPSA